MGINESASHREEIDKYLRQGYIDYGFVIFLKLAVLYEYSDRYKDLIDVWNEVKGLNKTQGYQYLQKKVRALGDEWSFDDEITYPEIKELIDEMFAQNSVIPDAWMFDGNEIISVEIFKTSPLNAERMEKYSWIDEHLYNVHSNKLRLALYEVNLNFGKKVIRHDLNMFFDMMEAVHVPNDLMAEYHSRLALNHGIQSN